MSWHTLKHNALRQLDENLRKAREVNIPNHTTFDNFLPISPTIVNTVIETLHVNDCKIHVFHAPVDMMGGNMYSATAMKFSSPEEMIEHFSSYRDCHVGLYQFFATKHMTFEFMENRISLIVRFATDFFKGYFPKKVVIDFISEQEMTL